MKQKQFYQTFMALMVPTAIILTLLQCNLIKSPPLWAIPLFIGAYIIGKTKIENLAEIFSPMEMWRILLLGTVTAGMIILLEFNANPFLTISILIGCQTWGWLVRKWREKNEKNLHLFLFIFLLPTSILLVTMGENIMIRIITAIGFLAFGRIFQIKGISGIKNWIFGGILIVAALILIYLIMFEKDLWGGCGCIIFFFMGLSIGWLYYTTEKDKDGLMGQIIFIQFLGMCALVLIGLWFDLNLIKWYLIAGSVAGGIIAYLLKGIDLPSWDKSEDTNPIIRIDFNGIIKKCILIIAFLIVPAITIARLHTSWVETLSGTDVIVGIVIVICGILMPKSIWGNKLTTKGTAFAILATVGVLYVKTAWNNYDWDSWLVGVGLLLLIGNIIRWFWLKFDKLKVGSVWGTIKSMVILLFDTAIGTLIGFCIGWFVSWLFLLLTSSSSAPGETGFTMIMIIIGATFAGCGTSITRR